MNEAATTWALVGIDEYDDQRLRRLQGAAADALEAVDAYCKLLLATGFRRQFLIMDGCLNYPYADNARTQIPAEGFPGVTGVTPDPANGLLACFAAAQDQRAAELDGRGAFMGPLLQALDPDRPWPDAVDLDFETGVRSVDIEKLVRKFVGPLVERQVFERARLRQSPRVEPLGTAQGSQVLPVYQLPQVETSTVDVTIEPAQAVPSVQAVLLSVRRAALLGPVPAQAPGQRGRGGGRLPTPQGAAGLGDLRGRPDRSLGCRRGAARLGDGSGSDVPLHVRSTGDAGTRPRGGAAVGVGRRRRGGGTGALGDAAG